MKKYVSAILVLLLVGILSGCSGGKKENPKQKTEVPDVTIDVSEEKAADIIPDPEEVLPDARLVVLNSEPNVFYQVKDFEDGDYDLYLKACKDAGFTDVHYEGETEATRMYWAYDEDHEYYLELGINEETKIIDIICAKVKPESSAVKE